MSGFFGSLVGSSTPASAEAQGRDRLVHWQAFLREEEVKLLRLMGDDAAAAWPSAERTETTTTPARLAVLEEDETEGL